MTKKTKSNKTIIVVAIALLSMAVFFFLEIKKTDSLAPLHSSVSKPSPYRPVIKQTPDMKAPAPNQTAEKKHSSSEVMGRIVARCLGSDFHFETLTELKKQILAKESIKSETKDLENIHFLTKDHLKMRAQWIYDGDRTEFRLFKEMEDGLPDPIALPSELKYNPDPTSLASYVNYDNIYWQQSISTLKTVLENTLVINIVNSEVQNLEYYTPNGPSLHCQINECLCK